MQNNDLILAEEFCKTYKIGYSFINLLNEHGLIQVASIEQNNYIPYNQLEKLEQIIRLHHDLDINVEGIDAIIHLLEKATAMQSEIAALKQRLRLYEPEE